MWIILKLQKDRKKLLLHYYMSMYIIFQILWYLHLKIVMTLLFIEL